MSEVAQQPRKLRVRASLRFVPILRPALYALLVLSALFTFWAGGDIFGHALPRWAQSVAPAAFGAFLIVFSIYRMALMRARKYPAALGFFQIGLGAIIWVLLLPGSRQAVSPWSSADEVPALLGSPDPRVRALAAELAGFRSGAGRYAPLLLDRLADADPRVRDSARASLVRLLNADPAPGEPAPAAQPRFREALQARGLLDTPAPAR